jgi:PAS domain S-box-containing protein
MAVEKIASSSEVRAVIPHRDGPVFFTVREGEVVSAMEPLDGDPLGDLLSELGRGSGTLVVTQDDEGHGKSLAASLRARSFVAVQPNSEVCLVALDRVGADDYGPQDARLLDALAHELVLSLESYRLFDEVAEERERFRQIFTGSREGICLLDQEGVVRAWNPALEGITGYASLEMVGAPWSDRLVMRTADETRLEGTDLVDLGSDQTLEVVTRAGPSRWVAVVAGPVMTGQEKGWVILMRDVTDEQALEHAKSDFLSTVSHELRTPLTAIKGSLGILSRGDSVPQPVRDQMLGVLQRGSDRLERLVLNLLFVSQIDTDGSLQVMRQELDVKELLKDRVRSMAQDREVELELEEGSILARGDRERLGQAVDHLLENALKFDLEGPIKVAARRMNGFIEVSVVDNGPGIPEEDQERIFDRFVRLGSVLTRETQGPGIGLFIAREAVQAMGGSVAVVSRPGEGATFSIRLPASRPMEVAPGQSA